MGTLEHDTPGGRGAFRSTGSTKAFTLIEAIAVLVLLGLLAAAAISSAPRSSAGVVTESDQLAAHLRYAQTRALADVEPWRLEFLNSSTYQIGPVNGSPVRIPGAPGETRNLGSGVTVSGPGEIRFDMWGRPVDGDGNLSSTINLTLADGSQTATISVTSGTGLIR